MPAMGLAQRLALASSVAREGTSLSGFYAQAHGDRVVALCTDDLGTLCRARVARTGSNFSHFLGGSPGSVPAKELG